MADPARITAGRPRPGLLNLRRGDQLSASASDPSPGRLGCRTQPIEPGTPSSCLRSCPVGSASRCAGGEARRQPVPGRAGCPCPQQSSPVPPVPKEGAQSAPPAQHGRSMDPFDSRPSCCGWGDETSLIVNCRLGACFRCSGMAEPQHGGRVLRNRSGRGRAGATGQPAGRGSSVRRWNTVANSGLQGLVADIRKRRQPTAPDRTTGATAVAPTAAGEACGECGSRWMSFLDSADAGSPSSSRNTSRPARKTGSGPHPHRSSMTSGTSSPSCLGAIEGQATLADTRHGADVMRG